MSKDKAGQTARENHRHNWDGPTRQEGNYIVVYCTCGDVRSRTYSTPPK